MAQRRQKSQAAGGDPSGPVDDGQPGVLITFRRDRLATVLEGVRQNTGIASFLAADDFDSGAIDLAQATGSDMIVFNQLGVAIASGDPDQMSSMVAAAADDDGILHVEREPVFWTTDATPSPQSLAYLRGYRDAVNHLYDRLTGGQGEADAGFAAAAEAFQDTATRTWGLAATRAVDATGTGRGVKLAVLDTGIDLDHPDFAGRAITSQSFIPGQAVQDDNGHGTHCAGTAAGTRAPGTGPRYGIASEATLFVGKVLSNQGSARGRSALAGLEWALRNECHIVSMSLGAPVAVGESFSVAFEQIGRAAMERNTLIVAAAGNDSERSSGVIQPVNSPANCPSIMAVAAVDRALRVADFSCGAVNTDGRVDISGPGVDILSSTPDPAAPLQPPFFHRWRAKTDAVNGTSQATPHVAGIAALLREANPDLSGADLWRLLIARARALPAPARDVGAGLVQA
jgi:subtilisin family serine protease